MIGMAVLYVSAILAVIVSIPVLIFAVECIVGSLPSKPRPSRGITIRPPVAVLMAAHNESLEIAEALKSIKAQMREGDRLIVVADNCTDDTADIARAIGAEVVERFDNERRAKGYAVDFGVSYLRQSPLPVMAIIDADCKLGEGALDRLVADTFAKQRPIQGRYVLFAPPGSGIHLAVAQFSFHLKNHVRLRGLTRLGLPCLLTGSGMAFPWALLEKVDLATGHLSEDTKLGLDLAKVGHSPTFCEDALIASLFPYTASGELSQRRRWEGGHLRMLRKSLRELLRPSTWMNGGYLTLVLDIAVPPLTLLFTIVTGLLIFGAALAMAGLGYFALFVAIADIVLLLTALVATWYAHGRDVLPARNLFAIPRYAAAKFMMYPRMLWAGHPRFWIRTDRARRG